MSARPAYFLVAALALFAAAVGFALGPDPWRVNAAGTAIAPNVSAGLASLGFAVAGGLSLLAAALALGDRTPPKP